jgi:hypothetical protein
MSGGQLLDTIIGSDEAVKDGFDINFGSEYMAKVTGIVNRHSVGWFVSSARLFHLLVDVSR